MTIPIERATSLRPAAFDIAAPPRVSVIMPMFNAERFLGEAVESVLAQTYREWELLLIDDGSTDGSRQIAERYATEHPERIRFLHHPGHGNRGASATRNLGIAHARGEYLALLDADDIWLPTKLADQVPVLDARPDVGMVCNDTLIWKSWASTPDSTERDYAYSVGVPANSILHPPQFLALSFRGKAASPCTCSVLIRKRLVDEVGGFEEQFRQTFTDQALYAKLFLAAPILVLGGIRDQYRQHPDSSCELSLRAGRAVATELQYLDWLEAYLADRGLADGEAGKALRWYRYWRHDHPRIYRWMREGQILAGKVRSRAYSLGSMFRPSFTRNKVIRE